MASDLSIFQRLDAQLERLFAGWDIYSSILLVILIAYLLYPILFTPDPDLHPLILARQSQPSYVRYPGESAVFRNPEIPHGYPLKTGLNVKDPSAPRWASGRDGDLRDVWKKATNGPIDATGNRVGKPGKVLSVLGKEDVVEFSLEKISGEIIAVGQHMRNHGGSRVAIYLPNSVEHLVAFFACAFYGLTPVLIPLQDSLETLTGILRETQADVLVANAGAVPLKELQLQYGNLKQVIWIVEPTSRHMDWNEVPEGAGGKADVAAWHDIVDEKAFASSDLPTDIPGGDVPNVLFVAEDGTSAVESYEIIQLTQKNIVAGIAAQISALPRAFHFSPADVLTPLAPLTDIYPLTITLAVLHSNGSLALTAVHGHKVPYNAAFLGAAPTIVIAGTQTLTSYWSKERDNLSPTQSFRHWRRSKSLEAGVMPKIPGNSLRLIYTYSTTEQTTAELTPGELDQLRIFTGARIVNAYSDARVAGAISQTHILDYRKDGKNSRFGPPLSSLEIWTKDAGDMKSEGSKAIGQLVVSGPAVLDGKVTCDHVMEIREDGCLASLD